MSVNSEMTALANAVRSKSGKSGKLTISEMTAAVSSINTSGGTLNLQSKTVTPTTSAQTVTPDSGYDGLSSVRVNAMPTATQATPTISVNSSTGVITASVTQSEGYVTQGTKSATSNLTTQAAKTVTPGTSSQTAVAAGRYTTGAVTVAGDANLIAANIVSGKTIFNVQGSHTCSAGAPDLQAKTVTPTTSQQVVKPDSNYDGLSQVTVNAIPSNYVDSASVEALLKAI